VLQYHIADDADAATMVLFMIICNKNKKQRFAQSKTIESRALKNENEC